MKASKTDAPTSVVAAPSASQPSNGKGSNRLAPQPEIYSREEHQISRSGIDPDALKIMYRLIRAGFKAYLVGGGVRDLLLGKKPKDFDIATDATPRRVKALFSNSRIIGRRFKLVHVFFGGGKIIEVSTFRDATDPIDDEDQGVAQLAADNKYGTEVTDALRRDVTINGLFYDLSTFSVIDYVGGIRDLSDRVIRVIGDARVRFREDPVRMLRVVRHAARAGFAIDRDAWTAVGELKQLLASCPSMRIFEELKKDLQSGHFLKIMRLLAQSGLLEELIPELLSDYPGLFEDKSLSSEVLAEIDQRFRVGKGPSLSVVLSALVILCRSGLDRHAIRRGYCVSGESVAWDDEEQLYEWIKQCFVKLSVPRRERERVEMILGIWLEIQGASEEDEAPRITDEVFDDVLELLSVLGVDERRIAEVERPGPARRQRRGPPREQGAQDARRGRRRRGGRNRGGRRNAASVE